MIGTAPTQEEVDAAVAAMVANRPDIRTSLDSVGGGDTAPATLAEPRGLERLQRARERRLALRSAMGALRGRGHTDFGAVRLAVAEADVAKIVAAVARHALGQWLDANCGRPSTELHELSANIEHELVASVYADAPQILASLPDDGLDVAYIRQLAQVATTMDTHLFDLNGQPTKAKVPSLSVMQTLVPR